MNVIFCLLVLLCTLSLYSTIALKLRANSMPFKTKVAVIDSGNWGTAVARRIATNVKENKLLDNKEVKMWVFDEKFGDRYLSDIINTDHVNPKYLPNVKLPASVVADTDLLSACRDADILLFVVPHQFLPGVLSSLKGNIKQNAIGVSLIKGIQFSSEGPVLLTELIQKELGISSTAAVMGANVASDVASDAFVEATVASIDINVAKMVAELFNSPEFQTEVCTDQSTVELCGALKNVVAIGAGFCDGLQMGVSSKAALIRQGTQEIARFCQLFDRTGNYKPETMMLSCGIADIIATCFGGRNRKCGMAFAERTLANQKRGHDNLSSNGDVEKASTKLWESIESELLGGQKLQGVDTCREVYHCLKATNQLDVKGQFPLFRRIHGIACEGQSLDTLFDWTSL